MSITLTRIFEVECLAFGEQYPENNWRILQLIQQIKKNVKIKLHSRSDSSFLDSIRFKINNRKYELCEDEYLIYSSSFIGFYIIKSSDFPMIEEAIQTHAKTQKISSKICNYAEQEYSFTLIKFSKDNLEDVLQFLHQGDISEISFYKSETCEDYFNKIIFTANNAQYVLKEGEYLAYCDKFNGFYVYKEEQFDEDELKIINKI